MVFFFWFFSPQPFKNVKIILLQPRRAQGEMTTKCSLDGILEQKKDIREKLRKLE